MTAVVPDIQVHDITHLEFEVQCESEHHGTGHQAHDEGAGKWWFSFTCEWCYAQMAGFRCERFGQAFKGATGVVCVDCHHRTPVVSPLFELVRL